MSPVELRTPTLFALAALALSACALPPSALDRATPARVEQIETADWIGEVRVSAARNEIREGRRWLRLELEVQDCWKGARGSTQTLLAPLRSDGVQPTAAKRLEGARLVLFAQHAPDQTSELWPLGGSLGLYHVRPGEQGERLIPVAAEQRGAGETLSELREQVQEWVDWDRFQRRAEIEQTLDELRHRQRVLRDEHSFPARACTAC